MLAEEVARARNHADPNDRAEKVEYQKLFPRHAQHACHWSGKNSHSENKAGEEDSHGTVAREKLLTTVQGLFRNSEKGTITFKQRPPAVVAKRKTEIVANGRGNRRDDNDPRQSQFVLGIGEKAGNEKNSLARDRDAGILDQKRRTDSPIAILHHRIPQQVENGMGHAVLKKLASYGPASSLPEIGLYLSPSTSCWKAQVEASLQIGTTIAQDQNQALLESENALAIIRDVYYMKQMAVEVVSQLALDTIANMPTDSAVFSQLLEQVQEEYAHLNRCRALLAKRDALGTRPRYVRHFVSVMRSCARKRRRTLPLAAAVILCIAVERSAMQQLVRITIDDREITELFQELGADEEEHYRLVTGVAAPCAAGKASLLERARTHLVMLRVALITLVRWWPRQRRTYQACGLNTEVFLLDVLGYASRGLFPIGLLFPRRAILRLAKISLGIS